MAAMGAAGVDAQTLTLWEAIDDDDLLGARHAFNNGANVAAANRMGLTALHRACAAGSHPVARMLAQEAQAPLDARDRVGTTPLAMAAGRGHKDVVTMLLERGADAAIARDDGMRALHLACSFGHVSTALAILRTVGAARAGALDADKEGATPAAYLAGAVLDPSPELNELRATLTRAAEGDGVLSDLPPPSPPPPSPLREPIHAPATAAPVADGLAPVAEEVAASPSAAGGPSLPGLTREEGRRYSRHLLLPEVGISGQRKLKAATILVVGAGGLGSPALLYLAAAGVGTLVVVDDDVVDESNLQRQVIHSVGSLGRGKAESARQTLTGLNPHATVRAVTDKLDRTNALALVREADVVLDCTDSLAARYTVSDACAELCKPLVYGAVSKFEGHVAVFRLDQPESASYRDLYPTPPRPGAVQNCAAAGVLGVVPGMVGTIQATEALKLILGVGRTLDGTLLIFNALDMSFSEFRLARRPDIVPSATGHWALGAAEEEAAAAAGAEECAEVGQAASARGQCSGWVGKETVVGLGTCASGSRVDAADAAARMARGWQPFLLDVRTAAEAEISKVPGEGLRCAHDALTEKELSRVPVGQDVLVYCRTGVRSAAACGLIVREGWLPACRVFDLVGGVNAWAEHNDPTMLQY